MIIRCFCFIVLAGATGAVSAPAADTVSGSFTANGDVVALGSVIVEAGLGEVSLLMTEKPLPAGCGVYDAFTIADSNVLRGVAVTISRESQEIERAGLNALYHESWEGRLANIGQPEVRIDQLDETVMKGSINLAGGEFADYTFSYDVSFEVGLSSERPVIEAKVSGQEESSAARAYAAYYTAMMAGRMDDGRKYVTQENAEQMVGEDVEFFLDMFQDLPHELIISAAKEQGDKAELTVEGEIVGCMATEKATGTVELERESGGWKVTKESWEL